MLGTRATRSAPAAAPGDGERGTRAHSGAQTHTERSATPQSLGASGLAERIAIDGEFGCRLGRAATRPPAGAAFGWSRRLGALLLPARRLGAGRPRSLPRVAHHRLGGFAFARECRRAGSCAELLLGGRRRIGRLLACPAAGRPDRGDRSLPAVLRGTGRALRIVSSRPSTTRPTNGSSAAWSEALARAEAASADVLHLHHLTPANWPFREAEAIPCAGAAALNRVGERARCRSSG
jgi:hypothetical protein